MFFFLNYAFMFVGMDTNIDASSRSRSRSGRPRTPGRGTSGDVEGNTTSTFQ